MTTYIFNTNLMYYASRLSKKDSHAAIASTQFKTLDTNNKASKIDVQYENITENIHLYKKPRCYVKNYVYDSNFIYVGFLETDWTIKESDYEHIREMCKEHNIVPIFDCPGDLSIIIEDILNSDTFTYTHTKLNHREIYEKYCQFNKAVTKAIGAIKDNDIVWAQDFNFIHTVAQYKNSLMTVQKFNDLWKCIPYYKLLLNDILKVKSLNFCNQEDIEDFERFVSYVYFPDSQKLPNLMYQKMGIDKSFIDQVTISKINIDKNTIIVPYESLHHLICLDKFLNKYDVPLKIYLLNISNKIISQEILNYLNYLKLKTDLEVITPETDEEFVKLISTCHIGFYKSLDEHMKYFGRHTIESCVYDYENAADEIYKKLHYVEQKPHQINDIKDVLPTILDFSRLQKEIEYKGEVIEIPNTSQIQNVQDVKKEIVLDDENFNNKESSSRIVENTKNKITKVSVKDLPLEDISAIILDYDGTLVPIRSDPEESHMSENQKNMLLELNKQIKVVIASGRRKEDMDKFIPKELEVFSEHCGFVRKDDEWCTLFPNINFELELRIATFYKERTPGSSIEKKKNGFVFHYRDCDPIIGTIQAQRLFTDLIKISPYIKLGKKIVEYKIGSKENIFKYYKDNLIICGDDVTDEDMFDNTRGLTIRVGYCEKTKAEYYVKSVDEMLKFLQKLIK